MLPAVREEFARRVTKLPLSQLFVTITWMQTGVFGPPGVPVPEVIENIARLVPNEDRPMAFEILLRELDLRVPKP